MKERMRVLLVRPSRGSLQGLEAAALPEPLGLETLAGAVPDCLVVIADLRVGHRLADYVRAVRPHLCGISCLFTSEARSALAAARQVKALRPECVVLVGGPHASLWPVDFADAAVDAVAIGEGENPLRMTARALAGDLPLSRVPNLILNTPDGQVPSAYQQPQVEDLDLLPMPDRRSLEAHRHRFYLGFDRPSALVETSRGCPHRCKFCAVWKFHQGKVRTKSVPRVVEEIRQIQAPHVFITDDNFLHDVNRVQSLAQALLSAGVAKRYTFQARTDTIARYPEVVKAWSEVGPSSVFLGMESLSTDTLRALRKGNTPEQNDMALAVLAASGMTYSGNFMVDPRASEADFRALRDYVRARGLRNASFSIVTPLPGTDLFAEMQGQLREGNCELYDLFHVVTETALPLEKFYTQYASLWGEVLALQQQPRPGRATRLLRGLLSGRVRLSDLRRGMNVARRLSDAEALLVEHDLHSEPLPPGDRPRFTR